MSSTTPPEFAIFDPKLPLNSLLERYQQDKEYLEKLEAATEREDAWKQFSQAVCELIWKLLFDSSTPSAEQMNKAKALLKQHREDVSDSDYSIYNEWIYKVKEELLNRNLKEFFEKEIVHKLLGPCWSWSTEPPPGFVTYSPDGKEMFADFSEFDPSQSEWDLLDRYENAFYRKLTTFSDTEEYDEVWELFSQAVCDCIWKLLFEPGGQPGKEQMAKASALLKRYKEDATFQTPNFYNKWIYKFRDELLKQNLLDFWKNEVVAKELGPCWARDSDFYDDLEDPNPVEFYKHGGCEAAWLNEPDIEPKKDPKYKEEDLAGPLKPISLENAVEDFLLNIQIQIYMDHEDKEAFKRILEEAREVIWQLLFSEPTPTAEHLKMASELLKEYRNEASYRTPFDYNDWILKVRDELWKRRLNEFWQIIVRQKLGLCWFVDNVCFEDVADTKPVEYFKVGSELMKFYAM